MLLPSYRTKKNQMEKCIYLNRTLNILGENSLKYFASRISWNRWHGTVCFERAHFFIELRFAIKISTSKIILRGECSTKNLFSFFLFLRRHRISWRSHRVECRQISNDLKRADSWCCWLCFKFLHVSVGVQRVLFAMCVWVCILCVVLLVRSSNCFIFYFFAFFPSFSLSFSVPVTALNLHTACICIWQKGGNSARYELFIRKWKNNENEMESYSFVLFCLARNRIIFIQKDFYSRMTCKMNCFTLNCWAYALFFKLCGSSVITRLGPMWPKPTEIVYANNKSSYFVAQWENNTRKSNKVTFSASNSVLHTRKCWTASSFRKCLHPYVTSISIHSILCTRTKSNKILHW